MKKYVVILAFVLLKMSSSVDLKKLTSPDGTQTESDNKAHSFSIYKTIPAAARLVTAITLQNGISDGSIKADDVIVDLLNVGSVSLVELETFDIEAGNTLIDYLKKMPYEIIAADIEEAEKIEKMYVELHEIVEKWNILKLETKQVPTNQDFKKLDEVNNWNIVSMLQNVDMSKMISMLDDVIKGKNAEYESLKDKLTAFVNSVPSATDQYKNVKSFVLSLIPFCEVFDLMKQFTGTTGKLRSPASDSSNLLYLIVTIPSNVSASLTIANKMLELHSRRPPRTAPGFVNGYVDLKKLENNTKYSWINKAIASIKDVNSSTVALLEPTMEMFGSIINEVSTPENRRAIGQFNSLNIHPVSWTEVREAYKAIAGRCTATKDMKGSPFYLAFSSLNLRIAMLLKVIYSLETVSISITEKHRAIIRDLSAESSEEDLRELADVIKFLKTFIEVIRKAKPQNLVTEIHSNEKEIIAFNNTSFLKNFNASVECVAEHLEMLRRISSSFLANKNLRVIMSNRNNSDFAKRLNDIFVAVASSSLLITPLRAVAKAIEEDNSVNVQNLRKLSGVKPYTIPLTDAATVLEMIERAEELKNEFTSFVEDGQLIQSTIDRYANETFHHEILQYWGNFDKTILEIVTFFTYMNAWEEKLGNPSGTGITKYGNSLKELATIPSVELDVQRRSIAVKKLQSVNNDTNVKAALELFNGCLEKLSMLDLQFAGYHKSLEQMPDALENVYKVFHEYYSRQDAEKRKRKKKGKKKDEERSDMMIFAFIFLGVLAIVIIAGGVWWYLKSVNTQPKKAACRSKAKIADDKSIQSVK